MKNILTSLTITLCFLFASMSNAQNILVINNGYGPFDCVQSAAGASANFTDCHFTTLATCAPNFSAYDIIMVQSTYGSMNSTIINDLIAFLQAGGSVYFQGDIMANNNCSSALVSSSEANINDLLAGIGIIGTITLNCDLSVVTSDSITYSNTNPCLPSSYETTFNTGGLMTGSGLDSATTGSIGIGVVQAYYETGYGGILGIGSEYFSSGNLNGWCTPQSGQSVWDHMTTSSLGGGSYAADFVADNVCNGSAVIFTNNTPSPTPGPSFEWDFESDGTIDDNTQNPSHIYPTDGIYDATLIVIDPSGCNDTLTKQIIINPIPNVGFTYNTACLGSVTQFTDTTAIGVAWDWDFDNGNIANTPNPTTIYNTAGGYDVNLIVTSDSGCVDSTQITITVSNNPTADFSVITACPNSSSSFTDNSIAPNPIAGWSWIFVNGTSTIQNPTNIYTAGGLSTATLLVTDINGCKDSSSLNINIPYNPTADFSFNSACLGDAITFTDNSNISSGNITNWDWAFGDGNTSTTQNPTNNYIASGLYNTILTITSDSGCTDTITNQVTVNALPIANFSFNNPCEGNVTSFTDQSQTNINSWQWSFGDGQTSTNQNPSNLYAASGSFNTELVVQDNNGCTNTLSQTVAVNPAPDVSFDSIQSGCAPLFVNLFGNSTSTIAIWNWDLGNGTTSSNQNPSLTYNNDGSYDISLTVTDNNGCTNTLTKPNYIKVYPTPIVDFSYSPFELDEYQTEVNFSDLSYFNIASWNWNFGDGFTSTYQNPIHDFGEAGTYNVSLDITNTWGCVNSISQVIEIKPVASLYVPNAFTPYDGDNMNDVFKAVGRNMNKFNLTIYDRWGEKLFEADNINKGWDGTFNGNLVPNDVYVYKIKAEDELGERYNLIGRVTLVK